MGTAHLQADIGTVIVQVTFWVSLLFPVVIGRWVWKWWAAQDRTMGWLLMSMEILLTAAFLVPVLRMLLGIPLASTGFGWFSLAVVAAIPLRTIWLGVMIWRIQRKGQQP